MELYREHTELPAGRAPCALAIGSFDGLHLGHRCLLARTLDQARARGLVPAVLTFEPHPARALAPGFSPPLLMSYDRKIPAFAHLGVERVLVQRFTREFANLAPDVFVQRVLVDALGVQVVVVGDDFSFGRGGQGRATDLRALGERFGFEVDIVQRLQVEGMTASSTKVRSFLLQGRVRAAALLLGRPYAVHGRVVRGAGRGRGIGFATANLETLAELLPAQGVYATHVWAPGWPAGRLAATNIGTNPTFGAGPRTVESHVIDFDGDLLGQPLVLAFRERLRGEVAFPGVAELIQQIEQDVARTRELARGYPESPQLDPCSGLLGVLQETADPAG